MEEHLVAEDLCEVGEVLGYGLAVLLCTLSALGIVVEVDRERDLNHGRLVHRLGDTLADSSLHADVGMRQRRQC